MKQLYRVIQGDFSTAREKLVGHPLVRSCEIIELTTGNDIEALLEIEWRRGSAMKQFQIGPSILLERVEEEQ